MRNPNTSPLEIDGNANVVGDGNVVIHCTFIIAAAPASRRDQIAQRVEQLLAEYGVHPTTPQLRSV